MRAICRVASSFHFARNIATISQGTAPQGCRESLRSAVYNGRTRQWPQVRPCELPKIPLKQDTKGLRVEELEFCTEPDPSSSQAWVPLRIVSPAQQTSAKLPTVIFLHPTGSSMDSEQARQVAYAERGYLAAAIDCRYHGRRCEQLENPREAYQQAIVRAWRDDGREHPFLLDNVWDIVHCVDILSSRDDVGRIGITGTSLGGMHSWLAAALDERIYAAAPMIGLQGFKWALDNNAWQGRAESIPLVFDSAAADFGREKADTEVVREVWNRILPGLLDAWDAPFSLPACAPRPFLIASGAVDPRCPLPGVLEAYELAKSAYLEQVQAQGVPEEDAAAEVAKRLQLYVEEGVGHKPTQGMDRAIADFFDQHLRA